MSNLLTLMENIQSFELLLFVGGFALTAGQVLNWQLGSSKYFHILPLRDFGDFIRDALINSSMHIIEK